MALGSRIQAMVKANVIKSSELGYDEIASLYDAWHWQRFWKLNEWPIILQWAGLFRTCLDIGCGTGEYFATLSERGRICGVDVSDKMLSIARSKLGPHADLRKGTATALPIDPHQKFDLCLSTRTLSHIRAVDQAIQECSRVTVAGSRWLISDVHCTHPYAATRVPTEHGDVYIQTYKLDPQLLSKLLHESGFWSVSRFQVFYWKDLLWKPLDPEFERIDQSSTRAVFFVLEAIRM